MSELQPGGDFPVNIEDIMHTAYLQYSLSVNVGRAIPDVRDGLKPGNRRILYAMHQLGFTKSHAYSKCAKVVGEVIGNYHPHGDAAVYDTLVRMAQDFSMRAPLIDGQGNFGSIDGDPPAAYRYTECRLERIAEELLADIEKDTVNMLPTFDESRVEPDVLPSRFPNLLVNGTTGIGVGMATNIPPHNLGEVIDATVHLLENPAATPLELMRFLPGPDFPTGATICGVSEIRSMYETGRGVIKIRAKAEVITDDNGREKIIVTEIPYAVNKENMVKKIADLVNDKKITGISDLRDESSRRTGIKIVIDIKRGAMGCVVLNQLYAHTQMEDVFGAILLVVDHNRPRVMNLCQILQAYIDHRMEVVVRRARFELDKAERRAHIVEGLLVAVNNIDEIVQIIKNSRSRDEAGQSLISRFNLTKIQAGAILEMRLHQLTGLAVEDLQKEFEELQKTIAGLKALLADRKLQIDVVKRELLEIKERYNDKRRTEITHSESDIDIADLIPRHSCVITVSSSGYIKRVPLDTYRTQHRGGRGVMGMDTKEKDIVEHLFFAESHDLIFFITDKGFMHWLNVYDIPEGARVSMGKAIVNMIKIEPGELIRAMFTCKKSDMDRDDLYLTMVSHKGFIKKTSLSAFSNLRKVGIRALIIEEGDDLIDAALTGNASEILLSTEKGMACRFHSSEIRAMGRGARGVTGIRFKIEGDNVVSMVVVEGEPVIPAPEGAADESAEPAAGEPDVPETEREPAEGEDDDAIVEEGQEVIIISDKGMGKRSFVKSYRMTRRGARGVINIKLKGSEKVVAAIAIGKGDELLITTKNGQLVRIPTDEIRTKGRATMGVKVMNLDDGDSITGVTKVAGGGEEIPENAENTETAPDGGAPRDGTAQEPSSPDGGAPENT